MMVEPFHILYVKFRLVLLSLAKAEYVCGCIYRLGQFNIECYTALGENGILLSCVQEM